jgi:hypothetical protein
MSKQTVAKSMWRGFAVGSAMALAACSSDGVVSTDSSEMAGGSARRAVSAIGTVNNPTAGNRTDMTVANNTDMVEGACFIAAPSGSATGTGLYKPFMRVNVNKTVYQGWNTSTRPIQATNDAESNAQWTTDIRLSEIPEVQGSLFPGCDPGVYREVRMDINQANPELLALNQIRVYVHQGVNGGNVGVGQTLVWSLDNQNADFLSTNTDPNDDHTIIANKIASGSGRDDLILLIPEAAFPAAARAACPYDQGLGNTCNYYFTFFNEAGSIAAGGQNPHDATVVQSSGFEEWGVVLRPIAPKLTLNKVVNNGTSGGTATPADFTLIATGTTGSFSGAGPTTGPVPVSPAVQYTLSETGPAGYSASAWVCTGDGTFVSPNKITLAEGQSASCTITNTAIAPTLELDKVVENNNGGTAVKTAFTLKALNGVTEVLSGAGSVAATAVTAGIQYTLTESAVAGYQQKGDWSCTSGTFEAPNKVTLSLGQSAKCTVTNEDIAATLKLRKVVVNNNGGAAVATDFALAAKTAANVTVVSGNGVTAATAVTAGVQYTLSETGPTGYAASNWVCDGGTFATPDKITLAVGTNVECVITNRDIAPRLKLVKNVINNNGGTAVVGDFTLFAKNGVTTTASGAGGFDFTSVTAGVQYTLSETGPSGYTASAWSCTGGGTQDGDKITLGLAESVTCTITNNDDPGKIVLVKKVNNLHGGTLAASDFGITLNGNSVSANFGAATLNGTVSTYQTVEFSVNAGLVNFAEQDVAGYTEGSWSCSPTNATTTAFNGGSVAVANGQTVTCEITNTQDAPQLNSNTAYAFQSGACFNTFNPRISNWGWQINAGMTSAMQRAEGTATSYPIYAGAAGCDISKGWNVGSIKVWYDGVNVHVKYELTAPYTMSQAHAWIKGTSVLPNNMAPGQYPLKRNFDPYATTTTFQQAITGQVYIVAHAVVWGPFGTP